METQQVDWSIILCIFVLDANAIYIYILANAMPAPEERAVPYAKQGPLRSTELFPLMPCVNIYSTPFYATRMLIKKKTKSEHLTTSCKSLPPF